MSFPNEPITPMSPAVFYYSPHSSAENLIVRPLSPTSSIKGCFVRSRPTSAEFPEYTFSDFSALGTALESMTSTPSSSSDDGVISTPSSSLADDEDTAAKATHWARQRAKSVRPSDARSVFAPSTLTTASRGTIIPVRAVRRSDVDTCVGVVAGKDEDGLSNNPRRRTWPTYQGIRHTVSAIFHRNNDSSQNFPENPSSSARPSSQKKQRGTSDAPRSSSLVKRALSSRSRSKLAPIQSRAHLRRSRSFGGFTSMLAVIDDDHEADEEVDEVMLEAREVMESIRSHWIFEEVHEGARAVGETGLFERSVQ